MTNYVVIYDWLCDYNEPDIHQELAYTGASKHCAFGHIFESMNDEIFDFLASTNHTGEYIISRDVDTHSICHIMTWTLVLNPHTDKEITLKYKIFEREFDEIEREQ